MKKVLLFINAAILLLSACKKDKKEEVDNQKPSIIVNKPSSNALAKSGSDFEIDIHFRDNINLSQYKLEIHPNFDGHTHGKTENESTAPWKWDTIVNISGKEHHAKFKIKVPMNVQAGNYHFMAMCTDQVGFEAPFKVIDFKVINLEDTIPPTLIVNYPSLSTENVLEFAANENQKIISFQGSITDNQRIKGIKIQLYEHGHNEHGHNHTQPIYEYQNFNLNGTSFDLTNLNFYFYKDDLEDNGEYEMKIIAYDGVGNTTNKMAIFLVKKL